MSHVADSFVPFTVVGALVGSLLASLIYDRRRDAARARAAAQARIDSERALIHRRAMDRREEGERMWADPKGVDHLFGGAYRRIRLRLGKPDWMWDGIWDLVFDPLLYRAQVNDFGAARAYHLAWSFIPPDPPYAVAARAFQGVF